MSRKGRENTDAILGGLLQGGLAVAGAYQKQKQEEELDRDLAKAVAEMPENATSMQQLQYLAKQRSPVREAMARLMKDVPRQQSPREEIAPQQLFSNIIKKTLGTTPTKEQVARAEEIFAVGGPLLEEGVHPITAYNQARKLVQGKQDSRTALQKQIVGPSSSFFGGGKGLKNDVSKIKQLKKEGFLDDDEISQGLLQKGYGPLDLLDKFGLKPSPELATEIGLIAAPAPTGMNQPGIANQAVVPQQMQPQAVARPKVRWNPQDPAHQARALEILQAAKGNRALANETLAEEFER